MKNDITLEMIIKQCEDLFLQSDLFYGHGTDNAWDEAVALVLGCLKLAYDSDPDGAVSEQDCEQIKALASRRIKELIPVPYLVKQAWFAGLPFYVDERVIIPRSPLAEWIARGFEPWLATDKIHRVLDLCTGSGCIAIACAYAFPEAQVDAVDISTDALAVAKINVEKHGLTDRVHLIQSDMFEALGNREYDLIITNPPYVGKIDMQDLPPEYTHEPVLALESGDEGLDAVDEILRKAPQYLSENGLLVVEVGCSQSAVEKTYPDLPLIWLECEHGGEGIFLYSFH
ncbi:MAG: 50S ribosomal protein L3 N(5)-glutamine methyltransferase [Gammaproteobacteria bacterium]